MNRPREDITVGSTFHLGLRRQRARACEYYSRTGHVLELALSAQLRRPLGRGAGVDRIVVVVAGGGRECAGDQQGRPRRIAGPQQASNRSEHRVLLSCESRATTRDAPVARSRRTDELARASGFCDECVRVMPTGSRVGREGSEARDVRGIQTSRTSPPSRPSCVRIGMRASSYSSGPQG